MLSQVNKVIKRCLKNQNQVLCLSIIIVVTVIITMHLSPPVVVKNINNSCSKCIFIILLGVSLYYRSFLLTLTVLLSMFFISSYANNFHPVMGYSDDSIFSQLGQTLETMKSGYQDENKEKYEEEVVDNFKETINKTVKKVESTVKDIKDTTLNKLENNAVSLKDKVYKSLKDIQENEFPESSKKINKSSPSIGIGEYCAQGGLPDSPAGFDPNCMLTCETL